MKGVVSEVTEDDMDEEEEAEGEDVTDDLHDESLGLPPHEEGANTTFPATPLGKKVVTEGREEGPDEGEPWRLAISRRRRRSSTDEARHAELCALAQKLNFCFLNPTREGNYFESFERWMIVNEVGVKDVDSLTSEWRKYGVDEALQERLPTLQAVCSSYKKHLKF